MFLFTLFVHNKNLISLYYWILQVLVGHTDQVTCVAVAITNKSLVVSGSRDANLIVWDMDTGADVHLLSGHLGYVTCVKVAGDGSVAVSGMVQIYMFSSTVILHSLYTYPCSCY